MKERICDYPVDLGKSLREVLGDAPTAEYYLGVFQGMAQVLSRHSKESGFCAVLDKNGTGAKSVVVIFGRNGGEKTVEMAIRINKEGFLITGKEVERHNVRSPLIRPSTTEMVPEGAYALASRGGTLILLGVDRDRVRPTVLSSYSP